MKRPWIAKRWEDEPTFIPTEDNPTPSEQPTSILRIVATTVLTFWALIVIGSLLFSLGYIFTIVPK